MPIPVSEIPPSLKKFNRVWSDFEVQDSLLFKRDKGKSLMVVTFNVLVDLVANIHLQQSHIGIYKLTTMLRRYIWHQSVSKVVRDLCRTCSVYQKGKVSGQMVVPPTLRITTASPFELVALDLINLPTTSSGYVGCLMVVDHYSKWVIAVPVRNKQTKTVCKALENQVFPLMPRIPFQILTDNGPEFLSHEFAYILERYNVVHVKTTPYKASSNGAVERVNRTIGELLRVLTDEPRKWDECLGKAVLTYDHSIHSEISCTPAERILGLAHDIDSVPLLSASTSGLWSEGHPHYKPFAVGTLVLRKTVLLGHKTSNKFLPRFNGPYWVTKVNANMVTYELIDLEDGTLTRAHHVQLKAWLEPPNYIKKHFRFYGTVDLRDPSRGVDDCYGSVDDCYEVPTSDSTHTSSDEDNLEVPIELVGHVLEPRRVGSGISKPVKSILKPTLLRDQTRTLELWESQNDDPTSILTPVRVPVFSGTGWSNIRTCSSENVGVLEGIEDWDVSPIELEYESENSVEQFYHLAPILSDTERSEVYAENFDNSSLSQHSVEEEVNVINTDMLSEASLGVYEKSGEIVADSNEVSLSSSRCIDFSGFSVTNSPVRVTSVIRTYQFVRDAIANMKEGESTSALYRSGRPSLSPVLSEIRKAREMIKENRERSRARALQTKRQLIFSPPLTRSRGKAVPLPHIQPVLLERKLKDKP